MDGSMASGWTQEQNQRVTEALRVHGSDTTPDRWHHIALAVGGGKSADDVRCYYEQLARAVANINAVAGAGNGTDGERTISKSRNTHQNIGSRRVRVYSGCLNILGPVQEIGST